MNKNLTRWEALHIQGLRTKHQTDRNGMVIVKLWEIVYKTDVRSISLSFFSLLPEASVMGTSHKQFSRINFKYSISCKCLQCKKETEKSTITDYRQNNLVWKISLRKTRQDHFYTRVFCEKHNCFSSLQLQSTGVMFVTQMCGWHWHHTVVLNLIPNWKLIWGSITVAAS